MGPGGLRTPDRWGRSYAIRRPRPLLRGRGAVAGPPSVGREWSPLGRPIGQLEFSSHPVGSRPPRRCPNQGCELPCGPGPFAEATFPAGSRGWRAMKWPEAGQEGPRRRLCQGWWTGTPARRARERRIEESRRGVGKTRSTLPPAPGHPLGSPLRRANPQVLPGDPVGGLPGRALPSGQLS